MARSKNPDEHYFFTSESVSMGHPDKVSDAVSDAVLDSLLAVDNRARVACETMCTTGLVVVGGEITVHNQKAINALNNAEETIRDIIRKIGYTGDIGMKFDADTCAVMRVMHSQSDDISMGVSEGEGLHKEQGAGDQGLMFGFACRETPDLMPLPIDLSHKLVERHAKVRQDNKLIKGLRPDAKSQVTVEYDINNKPVRIDTVVLSTQHTEAWNGKAQQAKLKKAVIKHIIEPCMPKKLYDPKNVTIHVNPTGQFEIGGPHGDVGLTGRKIIVDTYGGRGRHGGGAFSGKDPSKVDRSAAYMARYIAKNLVASRICDVCEVQLSYAIGVAEPTSIHVDTYKTGKLPEPEITQLVRDIFPLTPDGILKHLKLRNPIFSPTASHGHFGRKPGKVKVNGKSYETFTWEKTDLAAKIKKAAGI
ncbi:methionine adenosyltransferase [Algisphaera agarilytica]|uniref:S-adenosylmethionine synthase n=1 Tax=Algisphaera agarilytica TaxID=1385975 RepID=A0A7X0LIY4_9BACT|nr:methionine adenosyltransferase [Algisphaera agarilytica]MBB6428219.1 S-adenosylmethionine synthetase [Algisphaera agarilytica]